MMFSLAASLAIKVTLLLAAALLADALLRRRWVLTTATLWNAVLLALLVMPLATMLAPRFTLPLLPVASNEPAAEIVAPVDGAARLQPILAGHGIQAGKSAESPELSSPSSPGANYGVLSLMLVAIYGLGVVVLLVRLLAGWRAANSLRGHAVPVTDSRWLARLESWTSRQSPGPAAAWSGGVTLLQSDQVDVPTALGVRRPVILIPSPLVEQATSRTVDSVLVHELAHVYRADFAWQLLDRVVSAALWLHPLMWIAHRRIAFIRERACDDFAVHLVGDSRAYGETLLDIAAGINHRRATRLGLTIVRSSQLARRLSAISQSAGSSRCVAAPMTRWVLVTAGLGFAIGLGSLGLDRASAETPPASVAASTNETPTNETLTNETPAKVSPELIAVTWQQVPEANHKRIEQPVWRPDGKRLTDAKANALLDQVKRFQTHWWNKEEALRPLVLVYRRPPGLHTGLMTSIVLPDGRRLVTGTWMYAMANGLTRSACSPTRAELKHWPAKVDLEVKVPLEDPQVFKTIKSVPKDPIELAAGVRWYIDPERGLRPSKSGSPEMGFPGGCLEVRGNESDATIGYDAKVWLRGHKDPVPGGIAQVIEPTPGDRKTLHVTCAIDDLQSIERVEFTRQRFRFERINGVATHLDLLPPDP